MYIYIFMYIYIYVYVYKYGYNRYVYIFMYIFPHDPLPFSGLFSAPKTVPYGTRSEFFFGEIPRTWIFRT
jgi:hypothetical protein